MTIKQSSRESYEPSLSPCRCGNKPSACFSSQFGTSGTASVSCACGMSMSASTHSLGYGDSRSGMQQKAEDNWNKIMEV